MQAWEIRHIERRCVHKRWRETHCDQCDVDEISRAVFRVGGDRGRGSQFGSTGWSDLYGELALELEVDRGIDSFYFIF